MPKPYLPALPITLEISIPIRGNVPNASERRLRNAIEDTLTSAFREQRVGQWLGCGAGVGSMDLSYETTPANEPKALEIIAAALVTHDVTYRAKVTRYHYGDDGSVDQRTVLSPEVQA